MTSHTRVWFALLVLMLMAAAVRAQPAARPNVVLIIADDLAWDDTGTYGHRNVGTPNIDRLAHEGITEGRRLLDGGLRQVAHGRSDQESLRRRRRSGRGWWASTSDSSIRGRGSRCGSTTSSRSRR